jgi:DNA-binding MarR family transcriptional regulator
LRGGRVHCAHKPRRKRAATLNRELQRVIETCPGYNLGKAYKNVTRLFEEEFRTSELTLPQFAVLVNIGVTESATSSEVAERLGSDLSTISRTMDIVVRRGLVEESRGQDRRVRVYRLSSEGQRTLNDALEQWKRAKRRVLGKVDSRSWHATLTALHQLARVSRK